MTRNKRIQGLVNKLGTKVCLTYNKAPITVRLDNRLKKYGGLYYDCKRYIRFQAAGLDVKDIVYVVLHELGHYIDGLSTDPVVSEYTAEKFAYTYIKRFFPKRVEDYKACLKWTMESTKESMPVHHKAYKQLYSEVKDAV